ncbi:hypothetical protein GCM10023229_00670 [Flavisolibacter ginsenosidimutans]
MTQNTGATHEIELLVFFACTDVAAFTVEVALAVGLDSAMIVDFKS